jgi:hypothetical protein
MPNLTAFPFGELLPPPDDGDESGIRVAIATPTDATGKITSAQLTVTFPIDPSVFRFVAPGAGLNKNEVGFLATNKLAIPNGGNELSVTFDGELAFLNVRLALADPKRDLGN